MAYALLISGFVSIIIFPFLKKYKQEFKSIGPNHTQKKGTPSFGGIIIILATFISYFCLLKIYNLEYTSDTFIILIPFIGYGFIGFLDDSLKHLKHNNDGLTPIQKLILQSILAVLFYIYYINNGYSTTLFNYDIKYFYGIFLLILFLSTTNATNLTDGLDGLLTGLMIISLMFYYIITKNNEINAFTKSLMASLYIFLILNFKKAKIFMGDTGSLALGGALVALSVITKTEIYLLILGLPYIVEVLSVIIQVIYYKITKKRIFKMAPIHHHFEKLGQNEEKIVLMFYLSGLLSLAISLIIYYFSRII